MSNTEPPLNDRISIYEKYQKDLDDQTNVSWVDCWSWKEIMIGICGSLILLIFGNTIYPGIPQGAWPETILFAFFFFIALAFIVGYVIGIVIRRKVISLIISPTLCIIAVIISNELNDLPRLLGLVDKTYYGGTYLLGIVLTLLPSILGTIVGLSHFQQD